MPLFSLSCATGQDVCDGGGCGSDEVTMLQGFRQRSGVAKKIGGPNTGGLCNLSKVFGDVEPTTIDHARGLFDSACGGSYPANLCAAVSEELFSVFSESEGSSPFAEQLTGHHALFCQSLSELVSASEDHLVDPDARHGEHVSSLLALRQRAGSLKTASLDETTILKPGVIAPPTPPSTTPAPPQQGPWGPPPCASGTCAHLECLPQANSGAIGSTRKNGMTVCCPEACGECGGSSCATRPGGASQCCFDTIVASGVQCDVTSTFSACIATGWNYFSSSNTWTTR